MHVCIHLNLKNCINMSKDKERHFSVKHKWITCFQVDLHIKSLGSERSIFLLKQIFFFSKDTVKWSKVKDFNPYKIKKM